MEKEIEKLKEWIASYLKHAGKDRLVLGLSGGVDSSVVAALAIDAIGVDNTYLVALPCDSDPDDLKVAEDLAEFLDAELATIDLTTVYNVMRMTMGVDVDSETDLVAANLKARLRAVALYHMANDLDALVIGTTNRSEAEIGYFTKGGDGLVDFEPLGKFWKTEVVTMGFKLGLPSANCLREPSAGLQDGVTDASEIGMTYSELDPILIGLTEGHQMKMDPLRIRRVIDLMKSSSHKRKMPPAFERLK